jgi:hypothetical protein
MICHLSYSKEEILKLLLKYKFLLLIISFIFLFSCVTTANNETGNVSGSTNQKFFSDEIILEFPDKSLSGELKPRFLNGYSIDFMIGEKPLTGTIKFGFASYGIDLLFDGVPVTGQIKQGLFKDIYHISIGDSSLTGDMKFKMMKDVYELLWDNQKISGEVTFAFNYNTYNLYFGENHIKGKKIQGFIGSKYIFESNISDDTEILIFLIIEIHRMINEEVSENAAE